MKLIKNEYIVKEGYYQNRYGKHVYGPVETCCGVWSNGERIADSFDELYQETKAGEQVSGIE